MSYKHLFFDLDDTLWDVRANQRSAQQEVYSLFGMESYFPDFESYYQTFLTINQRLWDQYRDGIIDQITLRNGRFAELLASVGVHDENIPANMGDEYLRIVPEFTALIPHCVETLEYLYEKGYPMSLVTNGFNGVQHRKVEKSGLQKYFTRIITSEFAGVNKPSPGIFEYAMRKEGINRSSTCVMIGDDVYNDIYGASAVGMPSIFVNLKGIEHEQKPTHEIRSLLELKDLL